MNEYCMPRSIKCLQLNNRQQGITVCSQTYHDHVVMMGADEISPGYEKRQRREFIKNAKMDIYYFNQTYFEENN